MPPQLRIDRPRLQAGKVIFEYSHHLTALSPQWMGYGFGKESLADLREDLRTLRDYLRQPEQMLLLAIMGHIAADQNLGAATRAAITGRVITFDDTSLASPLVIT